jgi:hypothetical protein
MTSISSGPRKAIPVGYSILDATVCIVKLGSLRIGEGGLVLA